VGGGVKGRRSKGAGGEGKEKERRRKGGGGGGGSCRGGEEEEERRRGKEEGEGRRRSPCRQPRPDIFTTDEHTLGSPISFYSIRAGREVVVLVVVVVLCVVVVCGFRTSSRCMWMSAIVSLFFTGFRNLPVQGRFCQNF
jgi:hypothetical protein